jgi:molybdate transport system regulatory protein
MAVLRARCKVWLESDAGKVALSDWRVALLEGIRDRGSLAEAARWLGVPYKTAWYKLKEIETTLGMPLVATISGGADHGGAALTPAGEEAVRRYNTIAAGVDDEVRTRFETEFGKPLG